MSQTERAGFGGRVREATWADREFVVSLMPRLVEFGLPEWHDVEQMTRFDVEFVERNLREQTPGTAVFIAEEADGRAVGFIHLITRADYYRDEEFGHVSDLVVAREGEGRGVGAALMEAGEDWARARGYRFLTLHVYAANARAREVYEKLGYAEEFIRCTKVLGRSRQSEARP
ncbi:MAG TPA: GNAT family N-acetyltransferase [Pyrinomonadaceae bacterium]|nr:GNAT family N-acetyltransferase [Pyrinomonadaceae bacterium]